MRTYPRGNATEDLDLTDHQHQGDSDDALAAAGAARESQAPVSAASWPDEQMAVALRMVVEAMHDAVGSATVGIGVIRDDRIVTIAAARAGTRPNAADDEPLDRVGISRPLAPFEAMLARARPLGQRWLYDPERHAAHRVLVSPVRDAQGRIRGVLALAAPAEGRLPDQPLLRILDKDAVRAARVVLAALEHEERGEQLRLLEAARLVISNVAATTSFRDAFEQAAPILMKTFRLTGMRLGSFDPEQVLWHGESPDPGSPTDYVSDLHVRRRAADGLWADQTVSVIGLSQDLNQQYTTVGRVADLKEMLRRNGLDSMLLLPLGAADRAIGALWLYRRAGHWTEHEQRVLVDIGRDLGRLFVNAQALQAEQQLAQALQELESYKRTLISMISHELKTPLAGILGNAEFLASAESAADIRHSARAMARGASRMTGLVEELLLIARLDQPGRVSEARPVRMEGVAREAIDLHRPVSEQAQVSVELTCDDAVVMGSREDLMVLVTNLVGNAVKYSHPGGRVGVTIGCHDDRVVLEVTDTGIGMDPDDVERLFGEFQRGTDAATLARPGTGLGLAIVDRIVRNHKGTIEVESARGRGSTIRVILPSARA